MSEPASKMRGRPKSEKKRVAICAAASELFLAHGYDGVSMDQVADSAGVSKQTVYSHFSNKDALFAECVRNRCAAHSVGPDLFAPDQPVAVNLRNFAQHFSALVLSSEAIRLKRLLCAQAESNPRLSRLFYEAGPEAIKNTLEKYLQTQVTRGTLIIDDTPAACRQLLYMIQGEAQMRRLLNVEGGPSDEENRDYVNGCVSLFLRCYGAPEAGQNPA